MQNESEKTTYWDISQPIHKEMAQWPGVPPVEVSLYRDLNCGHSSNSTQLSLSVHSGTHVDAPCHMHAGGESVDGLSLSKLVGRARVVDLSHIPGKEIAPQMLEAVFGDEPSPRKCLLKTANSSSISEPFHPDFVYLGRAAALWLAAQNFDLVGIDALSIQKFRCYEEQTHSILFNAGVVIVEGLNLSQVPAGDYELACLPLRIRGADGAPARAVLWRSPE